jgi:hypothetical protein
MVETVWVLERAYGFAAGAIAVAIGRLFGCGGLLAFRRD